MVDTGDLAAANDELEDGMSLAATARELLTQTDHVLELFKTGQCGSCLSCARAIGKMRSLALPRSTLCISCQKEQERD